MKKQTSAFNRIFLGTAMLAACLFSSCEPERFMTVDITEPANGSIFEEGDQITFTAVIKPESTTGEVQAIEWVSDPDGIFWQERYDKTQLGNVNITYTFSSGALSAGSHTITCRVKDSLLRVTGSDSILLLVEQKDDGGGSGGGDDDLVTQCNALASITVSVDDPTYSEYGGGTCSNCATKIRVKYVGPEDINGVRMLYKQPTVSYGPWLWKGMGPLPDVYEVALGVGTGVSA